jgi:hypothetical protein
VHPLHGTPASRPNTPQLIPNRPAMPAQSTVDRLPTNSYSTTPTAPNKEDSDIKTAYSQKQQQFHNMKKELDLKQVFKFYSLIEIFSNIFCSSIVLVDGNGF